MEFVRLDGAALTLVFALEVGGPERGGADLAYLGARLPEGEDLAMIAAVTARGRHESQPDVPPVPGLLPERKAGWSGTPAVVLRRSGRLVETDLRLAHWRLKRGSLELIWRDPALALKVEQCWGIGGDGIVSVESAFNHSADAGVVLERASSLVLPVPARFTEVIGFSGRWASEMRETRRTVEPEGFARRSFNGKPGFTGGNWLVLEDPATGEVLGAHLVWSGDHETRIECDTQGTGDGRATLQMGATSIDAVVDLVGESSHWPPGAVLTIASDRSALAKAFHAHLRAEVLPERATWSPRKVHLNSWEALGFNLSEAGLIALAEDAAALGSSALCSMTAGLEAAATTSPALVTGPSRPMCSRTASPR